MSASPLTVESLLERAVSLFPTAEIVSQLPDGRTHYATYKTFRARVRALGAALQECGLRRGDRVATLMWNHHLHLEACFGVPLVGGVVHALNMRQPVEALARSVNHIEDRVLIVDDVLLPLFERLRRLISPELVIVAPSKGGSLCHRYEAYEELLEESSGEPEDAYLDEDMPAVICDASSTARRLPGVVFTHRAIALYAYSISSPGQFSIERSDTVLPAMAMCHASAWGMPYAALMQGSRLVLPGSLIEPDRLLELISAHGVTLTSATLPVWLAVLDVLEHESDRWPEVRRARIVVSGSAHYSWLYQRFHALGIQVIQPPNMADTAQIATGDWLRVLHAEDELRREFGNYRVQG
ncbi:MAG TPA: AMP-binding protein [Vicinamibacterales bacterium]|nr:AMP-binding protein [Vicinamibacterales bacterium]